MEPLDTPPRPLAVTLVSATDLQDACRTAAALAGRPGHAVEGVLDLPGADSVRVAEQLAEELGREADAGRGGISVVALDPLADPMEVGLVLEHVLSLREPSATRLGILDVVSVTSVDEVLGLLFCRDEQREDPTAAERLASRLEFSSLIVLTGTSTRLDEEALVADLLQALAPSAGVVRSRALPGDRRLLSRGRAHTLASSMGWQRALNGTGRGASRARAVQEFVFRDPLPFHPGRLRAAVRDELRPESVGRILRSRGLVRLATRVDRVGSWSIAGDVLSLDPTTLLSWDVDAPIGQELAFFGIDLDTRALTDVLQRCLLTPRELLLGPALWSTFADPFPVWTSEHHH